MKVRSGGPKALEQRRDEEEAGAARRERPARRPARRTRDAAGDGDDFIGDRGQTLDQDDPQTPFLELVLKIQERLLVAVKVDDRLADALVKKVADGIAEEPADYRGDCADGGDAPRPLRPARTIGTIIASGGTGKKELSVNETMASHFIACGPSASAMTLS